ncbi:MAG: alpha/beta hydrolase [Actinobacteria bacterium]|nr:alpha/beta hydrolase [Actinomycetota bacterium]
MTDESAPTILVPTPVGEARAHLTLPAGEAPARAALVLGHGAGGGVGTPDLLAAQRAALGVGLAVALVEQPYRVAGRRSPPSAPRLDLAWTSIVRWLVAHQLRGCSVVVGGRSSGGRVACRTARVTAARGVLCLAFPLQPPARAASPRIAPSRQPELDGAGVPVLVVQGRNDRFGMPRGAPGREVFVVEGDHGLKRDAPRIGEGVSRWLRSLALP